MTNTSMISSYYERTVEYYSTVAMTFCVQVWSFVFDDQSQAFDLVIKNLT